MNIVMCIGRLTRDVELKYSKSGTAMGFSSIALNEFYTDNQGNKQKKSSYIELKFFGRYAEIANQYLRKGSKIGIQGKLEQERWVNQDGEKRYAVKIIVDKFEMLDTKENSNNSSYQKPTIPKQEISIDDFDEDEIPF